MKQTSALLALLIVAAPIAAQKTVLSGTVSNGTTGARVAQASVTVKGSSVSVVTNDDGFFTLKVDAAADSIVVSHVGYHSRRLAVPAGPAPTLDVRLLPAAIELRGVEVWPDDARRLVDIAVSKIPANYSQQPELLHGFYRETAMKRKHFIYVAEGLVDMYKTAYNRDTARDRVAIRKGRRLLSPKKSDTLSVKVMGGPVLPVQLDIVKNLDFLLNKSELDCYTFVMEAPEVIDNRMQYVVSISPGKAMPYALYYGKLYIDRGTLAFTRAELTLDVSDAEKATREMLVRKPSGVRFKPKELSCLVDYRYDGGVTRISYIRSTFRFNCDWRRRLFATSFAAFCEMVVTDTSHDGAQPISGRSSFDSRDAFYDRVDFFLDPTFWEDYNIIEPTESLDKAVDRLVKKHL